MRLAIWKLLIFRQLKMLQKICVIVTLTNDSHTIVINHNLLFTDFNKENKLSIMFDNKKKNMAKLTIVDTSSF